MLSKDVLLAVSVIVYIKNQTVMSTNITFPADIQLWCPYTQFCDLEAKNPLPSPVQNNADKFRPCCDSCSCSADCGLKRKCCKDEFDLYKIDETLGTICKHMNTKVHGSRDDVHYYMVDKCPGKQDTCRFQNVSNRWNYSPVFSRSNEMIYYNKHCAECHNQTNLVEFIPSVACASLSGPFSTILQTVINELNDECYLQFLVPADIDISKEVCNPKMKRDCKASEHYASRIGDLCESFNATFGVFSDFQNVYCYLCGLPEPEYRQTWMEGDTLCPATDSERFLNRASLLVLLDDDSVNSYQASQSEDVNNKYFCVETVTNSTARACRPVFCPEGQIRIRGVCRLFGQRWFVQNAQLFIKLTPVDSSLNLSHLHEVTNDQLASPKKEFLSSPELQDWEKKLFYRTNDNGTTIEYILAILFLRTQIVRPELLIKNIEQSLRQNWKLNITGNIFYLRVELNRFISYMKHSVGKETRYAPHSEYLPDTLQEDSVINWSAGITSDYRQNRICITKLFFCEQITFQPGEFELTKSQIYLVAMNKSLGNGEFIGVVDKEGVYQEIQVCMSDVIAERNRAPRKFEFQLFTYVTILSLSKRFISMFFGNFERA